MYLKLFYFIYVFLFYIYIFVILFLFVKCYFHAFRYCILGILGILYTFILCMFVKRLRAILIDRALYKYCIIIIIIIKSVTHCFDIVLEFSQCVLQFMFPAGQFLLGLQLEGRDGWDQGTTGTDRDIGSFGGPQPAGPGADRDRSVVKST